MDLSWLTHLCSFMMFRFFLLSSLPLLPLIGIVALEITAPSTVAFESGSISGTWSEADSTLDRFFLIIRHSNGVSNPVLTPPTSDYYGHF
ncbi:hypothetical protein C8J56DRAFT_269226 [Mycena floridula]|nr:hypothetical protein C8J56DRAFT_269226 [Mycena floridula]